MFSYYNHFYECTDFTKCIVGQNTLSEHEIFTVQTQPNNQTTKTTLIQFVTYMRFCLRFALIYFLF